MKLLFIGLDGLSFDTMEQFETPFLDALAQGGVRAKLISFEGPHMCTGPVWASVQTGLAPQDHGVDGVGAANWHTAAFGREVKTIWRRLNEKGVKCGLVNFPVTYPLRPIDSYVVCGFPAPWEAEGTHNPWERVDFGGSLFWPAEAGEDIGSFRSAWMNYIPPEDFEDTHVPYQRTRDGDTEGRRYLMALLYRSLHETARLSHCLMRRFPVDLAATVLMETDTIGHVGPALPSMARAAFLREADDVVRDLVGTARPDNVIVMSDHGCWDKRHTREGVFLAAGPAFADVDGAEVEVLEIAPTILYLWGAYEASLPSEPAYRLLTSGRVGGAQQEKIEDRLRALGYLE